MKKVLYLMLSAIITCMVFVQPSIASDSEIDKEVYLAAQSAQVFISKVSCTDPALLP
jgi:hypothetical protein